MRFVRSTLVVAIAACTLAAGCARQQFTVANNPTPTLGSTSGSGPSDKTHSADYAAPTGGSAATSEIHLSYYNCNSVSPTWGTCVKATPDSNAAVGGVVGTTTTTRIFNNGVSVQFSPATSILDVVTISMQLLPVTGKSPCVKQVFWTDSNGFTLAGPQPMTGKCP
jgi:hypothetical protein